MKRFRLQIWLELLTITGLALLFSALVLADGHSLKLTHLNPDHRLLALEHERLSGILIPVELGLKSDPPRLPTWNPFLGTGTPLVNDAFFYLFNPLMSVPMLVWGAVQGTKIAIIMGILVAGFNMWVLGKAIGLGGIARVTIAALFMFSGGILGKYHNGHFQLGLSLIWTPLVFAGLWWTLNSNDRRAPILTATGFTLLFFSGNIYYALHTLLSSAVIVIIHLIQRFEWRRIRHVSIAGMFALGLTMIQFLPVWSVRDYIKHPTANFSADGQSGYDLGQSIANFVMPWDKWLIFEDQPVNMSGAVDYAYMGPMVLALISALAILAFLPKVTPIRHRRAAVIAVFIAITMMIWGAGQAEIVQTLYQKIPLLAEFRFLGRANSMAALWWILLAGIALDNLWRSARSATGVHTTFDAYDRTRLLRIISVPAAFWLWDLVYSQSDNVTRLALALQNINLFTYMNERRLTNYVEATETLINLILIAIIVDTILLLLDLRFLTPPKLFNASLRNVLITRVSRIAIVVLAIMAINDVLFVNYPIIRFGPPEDNLVPLYAVAKAKEELTASFPAIQEPWSPSAYDSYYARIRNWGLNEGWVPLPLENDFIPRDAPKLTNTPQWAIAINGDTDNPAQALAQAFVEANNGVPIECDTDSDKQACNPALTLYKIPSALPYAFTVPENILTTAADTLNSENTTHVSVNIHDMDVITLVVTSLASQPANRDTLVVQETNFPGWSVTIDGQAADLYTVGTDTPGGNRGGFIGIPMRPGTHTYVLRFEPPGFKLGIGISAITLLSMILYLVGVRIPVRQPAPKTIPIVPLMPTPPIRIPEPVFEDPPTVQRRIPVSVLAGLSALIVMIAIFINSRIRNQK